MEHVSQLGMQVSAVHAPKQFFQKKSQDISFGILRVVRFMESLGRRMMVAHPPIQEIGQAA